LRILRPNRDRAVDSCSIYKKSRLDRRTARSTAASASACSSLRGVGAMAHALLFYKEEADMRFASLFIVGYAVFLAGVAAALWKLGVLQRIGAEWTAIGLVIAIGLGVMLAIGGRRAIEIDRT
jgi:hypothetical protein